MTDKSGNPNMQSWLQCKKLTSKFSPKVVDVVFEHIGADTLGFSTDVLN